MTLAFLGHDDIQFYLATNKEKRIEILQKCFKPEYNFLKSAHEYGEKEYQLKIPYEHEINIDYIDFFDGKKLGFQRNICVIWEIKSDLTDFGDSLRQQKRYKRLIYEKYSQNNLRVLNLLVYNVCGKATEEQIKEYFEPEIKVYNLTSIECPRMEEKKIILNDNFKIHKILEDKKPNCDFYYVAGKMSFLWQYHEEICSLKNTSLKTTIEYTNMTKAHDEYSYDIVKEDINAVEESKGTIAIITDKIQVGTITEILHCVYLNKPLLIVFIDKHFYKRNIFLDKNSFERAEGIFNKHHSWSYTGSPDNLWFVDDYWFLIRYLFSYPKATFCVIQNPYQITNVTSHWIKGDFVYD